MKLRKLLLEISTDSEILAKMQDFGLDSSDIDSDGYVTLFHGGKKLPTTINSDQIFFLTPNQSEAEDYAKMRSGKVFKLKVKPSDVTWNVGSREVEFDQGGKIRNGVIIPNTQKPTISNTDAKTDTDPWVGSKKIRTINRYKNLSVGDKVKSLNKKIKTIYQHKNGFVQVETDDGQYFNANVLT